MTIPRSYTYTASILVVALLIGIALIVNTTGQNPVHPNPSPSPTSGQQSTISGTIECLPHKDRNGPVTLECAYGIKTAEGAYYALDTAFYPGIIGDLPTGSKVAVTGAVTPVDQLDKESRLRIYDILGVIQVHSVEQRR